MVVMFVDCCVGGGRYFPYYSYHRNPMGREFFVPVGTLIAVKLIRSNGYDTKMEIIKLKNSLQKRGSRSVLN
jgi:hypothetical protein